MEVKTNLEETSEEKVKFRLGQLFTKPLTFLAGVRDVVIFLPHLSVVIQEPLRPEDLPIPPVFSLQYLGHDEIYLWNSSWDDLTTNLSR